jgi:transcriptional regulator with XRE-family HTH domain
MVKERAMPVKRQKKKQKPTTSRAVKKSSRTEVEPMLPDGDLIPDIGRILRRLRAQHKLTVREAAERSGLSTSFLHAVERGESDISLGRLARLAAIFGYDLGSFLGFTTRLSEPNFVSKTDRHLIDRGRGIHYESLPLPGIEFELEVVDFAPRSSFRTELSHEGIDVIYVVQGNLVLVFGREFPMSAGDCCVYAAGYSHKVRNDTDQSARIIAFTSGRM